jgi:DNA-binding NarL/FixJ family response regulator
MTPALTARQHEILTLMARGLSRTDIAARLELSAGTVSAHQRVMYAHLGVRSGPAAVAAGFRAGLLEQPVS